MIKNVLLIAIVGMLFAGCGDDCTSDFEMNYKLKYDGEPLVMFQEYTYPDGKSLEFTRFSFFISDVNIKSDNNSEMVKEVDYIDLTVSHSTLEKAENGYGYSINMEDKPIQEVTFDIGLSPEQNATKPQDYTSDNVLSKSGEYWSGWESYVMVKIEGFIDLDGDGEREKGIALHLGSDEVTKTVTTAVENNNVQIEFDLKDMFECNGLYDIAAVPAIHTLANTSAGIQIANNLVDCAISLD